MSVAFEALSSHLSFSLLFFVHVYFLYMFIFILCVRVIVCLMTWPLSRRWGKAVSNESDWVGGWGVQGERLVGALELCNTLALNFQV